MRTLVVSTSLALALASCGPSPSTPTPQSDASEASAPAAQAEDGDASGMDDAVEALPAPYNEASYEAGRRVFAQCRSCHTIEAGGANRVGPNLHGIIGRASASAAGFNYSDALRGANFTWDSEHIEQWLANPQSFLPGNRMAFAGVREPTQRRDLIAYLSVEGAR